MEKKHFPLEAKESSKFTRLFQIIFGILCILISFYWVFFQFSSLNADATLWITIVFLVGFGAYQIAAGLDKIRKFIEIETDRIVLKQNSFLPKIYLKPSDLEKIDIYPLSIWFCMGKKKKMILRFGLNYIEIIEPIKEAVKEFAGLNGISVQMMKEVI